MTTELCDLAIKYDTDKAPWGWNYTPVYYDWLHERKVDVRSVMEVGVWKGASLRMWRDFFANANVVGIDNDPDCMVRNENRITTLCRTAYDAATIRAVFESMSRPIDLFVDDARHFAEWQNFLLHITWPHIAPGGVYAIEETFPWEEIIISDLSNLERCENIRTRSPSKRWDIISGKYSLTLLRKGA